MAKVVCSGCGREYKTEFVNIVRYCVVCDKTLPVVEIPGDFKKGVRE